MVGGPVVLRRQDCFTCVRFVHSIRRASVGPCWTQIESHSQTRMSTNISGFFGWLAVSLWPIFCLSAVLEGISRAAWSTRAEQRKTKRRSCSWKCPLGVGTSVAFQARISWAMGGCLRTCAEMSVHSCFGNSFETAHTEASQIARTKRWSC